MLIVSVVVVDAITTEMRREVNTKIAYQSEQVIRKLEEQGITYKNTAAQIFGENEIEKSADPEQTMEVRNKITLVGNAKKMAPALQDVFLATSDGQIYSARGYSRQSTYFKTFLSCDNGQMKQADEILKTNQDGLYYLRCGSGAYLLFHYYNDRYAEAGSSLNYCMRVSQFNDLLQPLVGDTPVLMKITLDNAMQDAGFYIKGDVKQGIRSISARTYAREQDVGTFTTYKIGSRYLKLRAQVEYSTKVLYHNAAKWKIIDEICMSVLLFASLIISYYLSGRHYRKVNLLKESLEKIATVNDTAGANYEKNDFAYMQNIIDHIVNENDSVRQETSLAKEKIREQTATLLFHGAFKDETAARNMLEMCDYELNEPFYTVLCIVSGANRQEVGEQLKETLRDRCNSISELKGHIVVSVLYELPNEDYLKQERGRIAEDLIEDIQKHTGTIVRIGFGRVYENIHRISNAYYEAIGVAEKLIGSKRKMIGFIDTVNGTMEEDIRFDESDLEAFEKAIMEGKFLRVDEHFQKLLRYTNSGKFSEDNRKYLRYCILQNMILSIKKVKDIDENTIIQKIAQIDPGVEEVFEDSVRRILCQVCTKTEREEHLDFRKVVEYIERNFSRYDLSLDEVAEVAGLSKSYMSKLFKQKTGMRYIDYLTKRRMEEAKTLLLGTDISIKDISMKVGYCNVPGFRKKFKEYFGINASECRKKLYSNYGDKSTGDANQPVENRYGRKEL